jgi:hypothetical protein
LDIVMGLAGVEPAIFATSRRRHLRLRNASRVAK